MANPKKRRSSLFSLSARMRRREVPLTLLPSRSPSSSSSVHHMIINADGSQDEDDNCPLCIAARQGKTLTLEAMRDPALLQSAARRVLEREKLAPGEEASILEGGRLLPDYGYESIRYTVDAEGCIFLTRDESRTFVMRVTDLGPSS